MLATLPPHAPSI
jgi:hypothetical protein